MERKLSKRRAKKVSKALAFVALLVGLASLAVGFAAACDRLLGPDEAVLSEAGHESAPRTDLESA